MEMKQSFVRVSGLLTLLFASIAVWLAPYVWSTDVHADHLQVSFLAVGQGDAIFIETPDGVQVLVDGGPNSAVLGLLADELTPFDRDLDMIIGTHPDLDHVAGLVDVVDRYTVNTIVATEAVGASPAAQAWQQRIEQMQATVLFARAGQVIPLGASTTLTVLSPTFDPTDIPSNAGSIVAMLSYGEIDFLLTGDAGHGIEDFLITQNGAALEAEVLKLGHHGSDTSSGSTFLQTVRPLYAVVSAGINNRYNHPHPDVLQRVAAVGATTLTTQHGSVHFYTDGQQVWVE